MYSSTMTGYRFIVSNNAVQQVQNNTRICLNTAAVCNGTASLGPTGISLNGTVGNRHGKTCCDLDAAARVL